MSANDDLLEILKEALERSGSVAGRRMFGGVGVYFEGTFFALIADGAIYRKTSEETRASFAAQGSRAFSYTTKKGRAELVSYWQVPERLLDERDELSEWARASVTAARDGAIARKPKPAAKPKSKSGER